jgi:hypothetical protein
MSTTSKFPVVLGVVDLIPQSDSGEIAQNSEPSIGVNPVNPMQMFAGTFGTGAQNPFFVSNDGGVTWSIIGAFDHGDKSIAWKVDGSAVLVATLGAEPSPDPDEKGPIDTFAGFGPVINHYVGSDKNDQPWIRTGPSDHVYVAFNDVANAGPGIDPRNTGDGKTASVLVSIDGGANYTVNVIDDVGTMFQDDPAVRVAVNGDRVYAVFNRWVSLVENSANGLRFDTQLVVVRSDDGGADGFDKLGSSGEGVTAATHIDVLALKVNTSLTLGQQRAGGGTAIAVDPNNADHVVVAYTDAPGADGAGVLQLVLTESFDGGENWTTKFMTPSSTRSGQPGLAILANGAIGLLYNNYDPATNRLSQHLLTTTDDFATTRDFTLASESNTIPTIKPPTAPGPYVGDYFDLTGIGNTFYGIFSASNADDGTNASFTNVSFNRLFAGTPGTSSFQLTDLNGSAVAPSIDPFFFSYGVLNPAPPPAVTANMVLRNASNGPGDARYQIYNLGNNSVLASYWLASVGTDWAFVTLAEFSGDNTPDLMLRNSISGAFQVNGIANNNNTGPTLLGTVGLDWQVEGFGNFSSLGETDMILRNTNTGGLQVYDIENNHILGSNSMGAVGLNWQFSGIGNFSGRGTSDMLLRDSDTGELRAYNISNNQITGSAVIGKVGVNWEFSGVGNFSSVPGESDLLLRNSNTGALQIYDINNNRITGSSSIGTVGVDWQFAGVAPVSAAGASDLVLRNLNSGDFQVYNIANNQLTGSAPLGPVGLDWQLGGFAPSSPTGATGSLDDQPGSNAQLVQAMAGFGGGSGAADSTTTVASTDTSQQSLLATPQHG